MPDSLTRLDFSGIRVVLMDIDETILRTGGSVNFANPLLASQLRDQRGIGEKEAWEMIHDVQRRLGRAEPFITAAYLGLSMDRLFAQSLDYLRGGQAGLHVFPDALRLIERIAEVGLRLCTMTNNGTIGILLKFLAAGIIDQNGQSPFHQYYGDDVVGGQKTSPEVYAQVLKREKVDPSEILMIGDDRLQDGQIALAGGIGYAVIVDRNQQEEIRREDGLLVIRSLDVLGPILVPACDGGRLTETFQLR